MKKYIFFLSFLFIAVFAWNFNERSETHHTNRIKKTQKKFPLLPQKLVNSSYFEAYELADHFVIFVDFDKSRNSRRLWVIDHGNVLCKSYTSHGGKSSGLTNLNEPVSFSNNPGSKKSSVGIFKLCMERKMNSKKKHFCTCSTFEKKGKCIHAGVKFPLIGMERTNFNAPFRGIVIHTSKYVSDKGCWGNSDGCFVVAPDVFDLIRANNKLFKTCYLVAIK
jgi:hypothetical protein